MSLNGNSSDDSRFLFKNNGVLFENEMIQIGVKSEFRQNLGRLGLFYGNKTQVPLTNFQPVLQWPAEEGKKLNVQIKAVDSTLDAGAQIQQMLTAECIDSYAGKPFILLFNDFFKFEINPTLNLTIYFNPADLKLETNFFTSCLHTCFIT
jgi:AP-2 complex subunit alpha